MRKKNWPSNFSRRAKTDTPENQDLVHPEDIERAFNYSLKYLSFRARSFKEVYDYLSRKNFSEDTINSVLKRLANLKFLNDEEFARSWIESRQKHKGKSKLVLRNELKLKGLEDDVIKPLLNEAEDDFETARVLFEKKKKTLGRLPKEKFKRKMAGFLSRRGFSFSVINKLFKED
jgi:regulatory protein